MSNASVAIKLDTNLELDTFSYTKEHARLKGSEKDKKIHYCLSV